MPCPACSCPQTFTQPVNFKHWDKSIHPTRSHKHNYTGTPSLSFILNTAVDRASTKLKKVSFKMFHWLLQEPRKLSYAEVCQRPPKDPPPAPVAPPSPTPSPTTNQPLRELRVNKAEGPASSRCSPSERLEKGSEGRTSREQTGYQRGNGPRGSGFKIREQQRRPPQVRRSSPQSGYSRRSGKEQNIPPRSPK